MKGDLHIKQRDRIGRGQPELRKYLFGPMYFNSGSTRARINSVFAIDTSFFYKRTTIGIQIQLILKCIRALSLSRGCRRPEGLAKVVRKPAMRADHPPFPCRGWVAVRCSA